jgi:hypothetical protein
LPKFRLSALFILLTLAQLSIAQLRDPTLWTPSDSLNKVRKNTFAIGSSTLAAGSFGALYFAWYAGYPQSSFHLTNDNQNWFGMDKIGHATTTYVVGQAGYDMLRWTGIKEKPAVWYGGLMGWSYLAVIETMDGFSDGWGFSLGDMAANTLGSALFISQQLAWKEQRVMLKFSAHPTPYAQYNTRLLGSAFHEQLLKDYNGQTYWLSTSPRAFFNESLTWWPRWLCLSGGYGIDGVLTATGEPLEGYEQFTAQRQYYFSLDIDLRQIPMKSGFWKTLLHTISFIKIPAPTLEFNQDGSTHFHALYF